MGAHYRKPSRFWFGDTQALDLSSITRLVWEYALDSGKPQALHVYGQEEFSVSPNVGIDIWDAFRAWADAQED